MALPTALTPPIVTLRRELRVAERAFREVSRVRVKDDAPIETQHRYWRIHDTTKAVYARLDWRWQKTILRMGMVALALSTALATILPSTAPLIGVAALFLAWRFLAVLRKMAPGEDD